MELRSNFVTDGQIVQVLENTSFIDDTVLHVNETENAVFFKDGEVLQVFEPGRHILIADKYPFLAKIARKIASNSQKFGRFLTKHNLGGYEYTASIYFIDKGHKLNILWGTDAPIPMRDYEFGFAVSVRANGTYTIKITDAVAFIKNFMGSNSSVAYESVEFVRRQIKSVFLNKVKSHLARVMRDAKLTILDMASEMDIISEQVKNFVSKDLEKYGLGLEDFYIVDISIPENDPNYDKINTAYADRASRKINDVSWAEEKQHELMMAYVDSKNNKARDNKLVLEHKKSRDNPIESKLRSMVASEVGGTVDEDDIAERYSVSMPYQGDEDEIVEAIPELDDMDDIVEAIPELDDVDVSPKSKSDVLRRGLDDCQASQETFARTSARDTDTSMVEALKQAEEMFELQKSMDEALRQAEQNYESDNNTYLEKAREVLSSKQKTNDKGYQPKEEKRKVCYCTECGQLNSVDAKFCSSCGHRLK